MRPIMDGVENIGTALNDFISRVSYANRRGPFPISPTASESSGTRLLRKEPKDIRVGRAQETRLGKRRRGLRPAEASVWMNRNTDESDCSESGSGATSLALQALGARVVMPHPRRTPRDRIPRHGPGSFFGS